MVTIYNRWTDEVIFTGETLANLRGTDLSGADLRGANLREAILYGAILRGADLRGTDLRGADLYRADLRGANLYGADLREANLYEANLSGADLYGTDLREADLRGALGNFLCLTGSQHTLIATDVDHISIGCMRESLAWWRENYADVGQQQSYTSKQIEEYRLHIEYAAQWLAANVE